MSPVRHPVLKLHSTILPSVPSLQWTEVAPLSFPLPNSSLSVPPPFHAPRALPQCFSCPGRPLEPPQAPHTATPTLALFGALPPSTALPFHDSHLLICYSLLLFVCNFTGGSHSLVYSNSLPRGGGPGGSSALFSFLSFRTPSLRKPHMGPVPTGVLQVDPEAMANGIPFETNASNVLPPSPDVTVSGKLPASGFSGTRECVYTHACIHVYAWCEKYMHVETCMAAWIA
eukprot:1157335-Pelagomonas_calceolata.AAC.1